jgi:hypothetical protein
MSRAEALEQAFKVLREVTRVPWTGREASEWWDRRMAAICAVEQAAHEEGCYKRSEGGPYSCKPVGEQAAPEGREGRLDKYEPWTPEEEADVRKQVHEGNAGRAYYGADWLEDMKLALGTLDNAREREAAAVKWLSEHGRHEVRCDAGSRMPWRENDRAVCSCGLAACVTVRTALPGGPPDA